MQTIVGCIDIFVIVIATRTWCVWQEQTDMGPIVCGVASRKPHLDNGTLRRDGGFIIVYVTIVTPVIEANVRQFRCQKVLGIHQINWIPLLGRDAGWLFDWPVNGKQFSDIQYRFCDIYLILMKNIFLKPEI